MKKIGIYIHIPFCKSKCFYCNFYSKSQCNENLIQSYINSVCDEILSNFEILQEYEIETLYIGGGSPSLIDEKYIVQIIQLLKMLNYNPKEITIELNPENVTYEKLKTYKEIGINRISIGLQSANDVSLKNIGRLATIKDFENAYNMAVKVGFSNISCDVIMGLPNENIKMFENTVSYILSLDKITHISAYSLEVYDNTKLKFLIDNEFLTLPSEDDEREMKYLLDKKLENAGYNRYEISNYSKKGYESKHNLIYWNQEEYLGFGVAAASFISSTRYSNIKDIEEYISSIKTGKSIRDEIEELDKLDTIKEYAILKLRLKEGIGLLEFKNRFKMELKEIFGVQIDKLLKEGLLEEKDGRLSLSYKGEDLANAVWREFI